MARFVSWHYEQEDWKGKYNAWADFLKLYDRHDNLVLDTGWMNFDGRYNNGSGVINSNFNEICRFYIRWIRDLHSHGGGHFRFWVKDDKGNNYLIVSCHQCKSNGRNMTELNYRLPDNSNDSGWTIRDNRWRMRRAYAGDTLSCVSVCSCNMGNCSCRGEVKCVCHVGNCGAYQCACNQKCTNDCTSRGAYNCKCVNRHDEVPCSAHCANNDCLCQSNKMFQVPEIISSEGVYALISDIKNAAKKFDVPLNNEVIPEGYIMENHIINIEKNINNIYNSVMEKNPNFSFNYDSITDNMPKDIDGNINIEPYKNISTLSHVINKLCTSFDTCPSNCVGYDMCKNNCTCFVENLSGPTSDGYACPCNAQCTCDGQCISVCVNCSCNMQDTLRGVACAVDISSDGCYVV